MATKKRKPPIAPLPTVVDADVQQLAEKVTTDRKRLAEVARALIKGKQQHRASASDLADEMVRAFRGPVGIANRARIEYENAPVGSAYRARMLMLVAELLKKTDDGQNQTSIDDMTDDEIEKEIIDTVAGSVDKDQGSPKTPAGRRLLEAAMLSEGDDEFASQEAELAALDERHELDKLAADAIGRDEGAIPEDDEGELIEGAEFVE